MRKSKRVVIVGLPLFAQRVKEKLSEIDPLNNYTVLNTYYKWTDKLIAPFLILFADVVYSINGTLGGSNVLDLAFRLNKRIVMHWVGSDVLLAKEQFNKDKYDRKYFQAIHLTDAPWLVDELKTIGIKAEVQYISAYNESVDGVPFPNDFKVLTYIPENRAEFYGVESILSLAENLPNVNFHIIGSQMKNRETPINTIFHGWVDNVSQYIDDAIVTIRFVEHDGLSQFVLESLAKGRYVLYNNPFEGTEFTPNLKDLQNRLKELKVEFDNGSIELNYRGLNVIREQFNPALVMESLKQHLIQ